ncbi:hypothetical protein [Nocardia sp. NBC_00511]|uniref:hypothetical protein n=1 Tax=Nocardia sp. NBC_00511 TaxID=2903591 RepID=UPI0030E5D83A
MSNYWNLACRTCDEVHSLDWNHAGEQIQALISSLPEVVKAEPVMRTLNETFWRFDVQFPFDLARFAEQHNGHDLIAVDEYGKFFDACGEYFLCPCCGHSTHCKLPLKHEGDHAPRAVEASPGGAV